MGYLLLKFRRHSKADEIKPAELDEIFKSEKIHHKRTKENCFPYKTFLGRGIRLSLKDKFVSVYIKHYIMLRI